MDIFAVFATDPNKELKGVWEAIGPAEKALPDGSPDPDSVPMILVARANNRRYGRLLTAQYEANRTFLEQKTEASEELGERITVDIMAQSILLGWKNLTYQGEALPEAWSHESAKKLLSHGDFRTLVSKISNDTAKYKIEQEQAAAKN